MDVATESTETEGMGMSCESGRSCQGRLSPKGPVLRLLSRKWEATYAFGIAVTAPGLFFVLISTAEEGYWIDWRGFREKSHGNDESSGKHVLLW